MALRFGFIGFGEVGSTFANAMRARGAQVEAFDVDPAKVSSGGFAFQPLADLIIRCEYLLSTVTTDAAITAARLCLPYLSSDKIYVDLNSTSPGVKIELDKLIRATGARFVEGAILGAVGVSGSATRILACGEHGAIAAETLRSAGLNAGFYGVEIGKASTFKMLRGIFSKGLEALILELLIAGRRAGIEEDLWEDVAGFMSENPFSRVAENWVQSHATAHERRYHELVQIVETMNEIGVEPVMTSATAAFFRRSCELRLREAFASKPESMREVLAVIDDRLSGTDTRLPESR
jgi:3-hydroxyisobutyrate dehydrogenase